MTRASTDRQPAIKETSDTGNMRAYLPTEQDTTACQNKQSVATHPKNKL